MTPPASSARALHDILAAVVARISKDGTSVHAAWNAVAGVNVQSKEFAAYHAELLVLLSETRASITTLPPSSDERFQRYFYTWWEALVLPRQDWANWKNGIDAANLDQLASLADLVEQQARFASPPGPNAVEVLQKAVSHLVGVVEKDTELPGPVRDSVLADLNHTLWLLVHVDTFGVDHAVAATERVAGETLSAATKFGHPKLKAVGAGVLLALALVTQGTTDLDTIATNVKHTLGISQEAPAPADDPVNVTITQIVELSSPPKKVGAGQSARQQDSDILEGEIVGEGAAG